MMPNKGQTNNNARALMLNGQTYVSLSLAEA